MALGATQEELIRDCVLYIRIGFLSMPAYSAVRIPELFVAAQKPGLSLKANVAAGIVNGILDYVLIVIFHWGLAGAAIATSAGQIVGGLIPVIYFMRKNDSLLQFKKFHMHMDVIGKVCINGSSEMVTNLSSSIVNILYNFQLMKLARRRRNSSLWRDFIYQYHIYGHFHGLFHRKCTDCQLSLRGGESYGAEKPLPEEPDLSDDFRCGASGSIRGIGKAIVGNFRQL